MKILLTEKQADRIFNNKIECEKCGKEFKYNYLLIKHLNKKYSCEKVEKINNNYDDKIKKTKNVSSIIGIEILSACCA